MYIKGNLITLIPIQIGLSPLHAASKGGHCDVIELLIEKKASINIQDKVSVKAIRCVIVTL